MASNDAHFFIRAHNGNIFFFGYMLLSFPSGIQNQENTPINSNWHNEWKPSPMGGERYFKRTLYPCNSNNEKLGHGGNFFGLNLHSHKFGLGQRSSKTWNYKWNFENLRLRLLSNWFAAKYSKPLFPEFDFEFLRDSFSDNLWTCRSPNQRNLFSITLPVRTWLCRMLPWRRIPSSTAQARWVFNAGWGVKYISCCCAPVLCG